jgi:hypothetical protein
MRVTAEGAFGIEPCLGVSTLVRRLPVEHRIGCRPAEQYRIGCLERLFVLPHPEILTYVQRKTADYDRWLGGMRRQRARTWQSP